MDFKEINVRDIKENLVKLICDDWMLISAGNADSSNTMTASWGFMGEMWYKDCAAVVVRPSRHTYKFMEENEYFSLCFFEDEFKDILKFCGSKSGRDVDKIKETGLKPVYTDNTVYYEQAKIVVICRKMYASDLDPESFTDKAALDSYGGTNYHRVYVGEIVKVLAK